MHVFVEADTYAEAIEAAKTKEPGLATIDGAALCLPPVGVKIASDDPTRDAAESRIISDQRAMIETLTAKVAKYEAALKEIVAIQAGVHAHEDWYSAAIDQIARAALGTET